ncbi:MAG: hypothetical protein ACOCX9_03520 [Spirochaetota bacterium]
MKILLHIFLPAATAVMIMLFPVNRACAADSHPLLQQAERHIENRQYYHAVTELMRYQFIYPGGEDYYESMLMMGKAYYLGDNYYRATQVMAECYNTARDTGEGEKALYFLGIIRLKSGSPFFAYRTIQEYMYIYPEGPYNELSQLHACHALALMNDHQKALDGIHEFLDKYPQTQYREEALTLEKNIIEQVNRPRKSPLAAFLGSLVIPGFGHFYTGNIGVGLLSFFTNAGLIYLIYDGYTDGDMFRAAFFGFIELSFYQYSLFNGVRSVHEYNSDNEYYNTIRMSVKTRF